MTFQFPNRKTRRSMGLRGPIGLLGRDPEAARETPVPRFVRRHFEAFASASTRRQRKARARIRRIVRPLGIDM